MKNVIAGKDDVIEKVLICLFCGGHVLLEDVPGVGKTVLARSLAKSLDARYKRIQFTPDLLPSDLTGINFYNLKLGEFVFRPGPLFANIVLADEINRATPRTQASLLECMEECQVTVDGESRSLTTPFFVIATQNPVETHGTFPLPEAQLDRFCMRLRMGYPSFDDSRSILDRFEKDNPLDTLENAATAQEVAQVQTLFRKIHVCHAVKDYILRIIEKTREDEKVLLGVSPRGSLALMKSAQVQACFRGRAYVTPDDIKDLAVPVLSHRIIVRTNSFAGETAVAENKIAELLEKVAAPVESPEAEEPV
ncbi:MAG: MoxR family ATPase [Clostridiaceae bacterium]|nr:MoxR family ATPase [Clostridiaceae bacterium]